MKGKLTCGSPPTQLNIFSPLHFWHCWILQKKALAQINGDVTSRTFSFSFKVRHCGLAVSKHGLYVGGPGSIPNAITTRTAAGGDAEHVSLNHWLAPPYQGVKLVPAKCWEDSYRCWPWVGCKWLLSHHLKVMAHTKVRGVPCWELKCKVVR